MNFEYLSKLEHFNTLYDCCSVAEELVYSYPDSSAIKSLNGLDYIVKFVINAKTGSIPMKYDLYELLNIDDDLSVIIPNDTLNEEYNKLYEVFQIIGGVIWIQ